LFYGSFTPAFVLYAATDVFANVPIEVNELPIYGLIGLGTALADERYDVGKLVFYIHFIVVT
jgi:hypothetical protein